MKGLFITFEGPEGSGKSTHAARLVEWLRSRGVDTLQVREPGGTRLGEAVRRVLQHDAAGEPPCDLAETLLFTACRAQLAQTRIRPALRAGQWVVCDRFADSTTVYQGYGRGQEPERVAAINDFAVGDVRPDLTILLDVPAATGLRRVQERQRGRGETPDRMERLGRRFHERVRRGYRLLAQQEPGRIRLVDATRPEPEVEADIRALVEACVAARAGVRARRGAGKGAAA